MTSHFYIRDSNSNLKRRYYLSMLEWWRSDDRCRLKPDTGLFYASVFAVNSIQHHGRSKSKRKQTLALILPANIRRNARDPLLMSTSTHIQRINLGFQVLWRLSRVKQVLHLLNYPRVERIHENTGETEAFISSISFSSVFLSIRETCYKVLCFPHILVY